MNKRPIKPGDIMQLDPENVRNKAFAGCLFVVTEPKEFGAQGYVQELGQDGESCGQAYYRAGWAEMEPTGGIAQWMPGAEDA